MKLVAFIKKVLAVLIVTLFVSMFVRVNAATVNIITTNGQILKYDDETPVTISTDYIQKREMRGVWVSALTGDISGFTSKEQYQQEMMTVFETLEYYNMNTLIFHVRVMNDAFYESKYNSYSSYYSTKATWDPLPWIIEECHKRGIEFHAWMNPYRVTTNVASSLENIAKNYKPSNAASNPDNLLKGTSSVILNPGLPDVKGFLIDTCMELAENYDIDAIHFDDYFYAAGIDDTATREKYNTTGLSTADWRREQVNDFIRQLHRKLELLNEETGRAVQLGIAPTGVYKNGNGIVTYDSNGNAITTGSATGGQTHYSSYLYADTVKWINEGWIDYILPQTYWALEHGACPFADLITWWDKVVKNKNVNLYAALGLYMRTQQGGSSWENNKNEGYYQTMLVNSLDNTRGISVYNYLSLKSSVTSKGSFEKMDKLWSNIPVLPEIRTQKSVVLPKVNNLTVGHNECGNLVSWDKLDNAKFYVVYRSDKELTFSNDEVIDVIGNLEYNGLIQYTDLIENGDTQKYYYGVKALSSNNTLGEGEFTSTDNSVSADKQYLGKFETFTVTDNVFNGETITVRWNKMYFPFGDEIKYELYYSFDDGEEVKAENYYISRVQNCCDIVIPDNVSKITIKLKAYNNIGETIEFISKEIADTLPAITNFTCEGALYSDSSIQFVWNRIDEEGVSYTIQYSTDSYTWIDIDTTSDEQSSFNYYYTVNTPSVTGEVYYRVMGSKDGKVSYSNIIKGLSKKYIGDFIQFKVNGEELKEYYLLNEGDILEINWRKNKINSDYATYSVMYSFDLNSWQNIRTYSTKASLKDSGSTCTQTIPLNYISTVIYIKVSGSVNGYENESEIIKVYVSLEDLFFEDILMYLSKDEIALINSMDIYN